MKSAQAILSIASMYFLVRANGLPPCCVRANSPLRT